ncbi:lipoprotein insertase outer membrane protein LolB [Alteromonas lipotrueiana]|uniref:lipoprotein insertase outer membrane protein LolB n=1 Tax=Alteromonas lipotrueiana TaxID=2803815 RepID=UPI001C4476CD|nr:lipoprotein insertase outer membrane protein LolB [Alteromonas lipotrueiana]
MYEKRKIIESVQVTVFLYKMTIALIDFINMFLRFLLCCLLMSFLYGCTTLPDGPDKRIDLPAQLQQLAAINSWKIQGKMAIRNNQEAVSATLFWQNQNGDFEFRLTNFLGITLVDMQFENGMATLKANGDTYTHSDPGQLIKDVTGLNVPVNELLNWIKGLPGPSDDYALNSKDLLAQLKPGACETCGHWQIAYNNYGEVENIWLPYALKLTNTQKPNAFIKFRINQWTLM